MKELEIFTKNLREHRQEVSDLLFAYDLADLADDAQEEHFKLLETEVLKEHEFFAARDCERLGIKKGDRITDDEQSFLMSDKDFKLYNETYCTEKYFKAGLTDEKGFYVTNTFELKCKARKEFEDFVIDNVLPPLMREAFAKQRQAGGLSLASKKKLMDIFKNALGINK